MVDVPFLPARVVDGRTKTGAEGYNITAAVMLYPSAPVFVRPSTTLAGKNGTSTIYLYLPPQSASSAVAQELNTEENRHLFLPAPPVKKKQDVRKKPAL